MPTPSAVVTCFLRNRGEVLLLRRAQDTSTYPDTWGAVTGYLEHDDPIATARMEIREETGLTDFGVVRAGDPFEFSDDGPSWRVHPVLVDVDSRDVSLNAENATAMWTSPTEILRRETVPELWTSYDRVRPTPETIAADDEHGSAAISIHALEVLRDEAAIADREDEGEVHVREVAESLLAARPSMAALRNRINRVMAEANSPKNIEAAAIDGIERALAADANAASAAATLIDTSRLLTLSRSGTVLDALQEATAAVIVAESRPAREGVDVAEALAGEGHDVTLCTDAAIAHEVAESAVDAVLVGADTVLPDGRVVNKTGTRGAAIAATREGVAVYVVAASDKISPDRELDLEAGAPEAVYDGLAAIDVANPTFDVTPPECITNIVTERGQLEPEEVDDLADELAALSSWRE